MSAGLSDLCLLTSQPPWTLCCCVPLSLCTALGMRCTASNPTVPSPEEQLPLPGSLTWGKSYLIHQASLSDSGGYRCFQERRLSGGYLLQVDEHKRAVRSRPKSRWAVPASELVALSLFSFSAFIVVLWLVTFARQE